MKEVREVDTRNAPATPFQSLNSLISRYHSSLASAYGPWELPFYFVLTVGRYNPRGALALKTFPWIQKGIARIDTIRWNSKWSLCTIGPSGPCCVTESRVIRAVLRRNRCMCAEKVDMFASVADKHLYCRPSFPLECFVSIMMNFESHCIFRNFFTCFDQRLYQTKEFEELKDCRCLLQLCLLAASRGSVMTPPYRRSLVREVKHG